MNAKQKNEIIKMYAESIETEADVKKRIRQIEKLQDMFSAEITNWEALLREYAEKKGFMGVVSALDLRSGHTAPTPPPTPVQQEDNHKSKAAMPVYNPKSQEQIDAEIKELNERQMRYAIMMSLADEMYRKNKLPLERYYVIQEIFSEFYGFTETSIFYWDGPHKGEPIQQSPSKKNKTYTRRNTAYWEEYEKKHKKLGPFEEQTK